MIICGFPGVGKSYATSVLEQKDLVSDSDSSLFDKSKFPANYVKHLGNLSSIQQNTNKRLHIFGSSHKEVRDALLEAGLEFIVVIPTSDQKADYIERYKKRGSPEAFIKLLDENFENWIKEILSDDRLNVWTLEPGETLLDAIVNPSWPEY